MKSFSRSLGCSPSGSKLDIILRIRNAISKSDANFKKAFSKYWGCSGGWVSATCPHGIIYALKFVLRAESPRDYIDLMESMKHQPNVVVSDMANMLVSHGNKRRKDMFQPFNGMVAEPTQENIALALDGKLCVSLPWLEEKESSSSAPDTPGNHPVSGTDHHLCFFDRFHERNVKKENEVLRRITSVTQLRGILNSQKDEQLHSVYNHDRRYLNQMTPTNHIFLFRSNIDVKNEKKNCIVLKRLEASFKYEIIYDRNGRAFINKERPLANLNTSKQRKRPIPEENGSPSKKAKADSSPGEQGGSEYERMDGSDDEDIGGSDDERIDASDDERIDGSDDERIDGSDDERIDGSDDERIDGSEDERIDGSNDENMGGSDDERIDGSDDENMGGSDDENMGGSDREHMNEKEGKKDSPVPSPTSVVSLDSCEEAVSSNDLENYWIQELGLKMGDKKSILDGSWVNDRIVNAAMKLMKEHNPFMAGLIDVIIAAKHGFKDTTSGKFTQILNVRGNHWITISNEMSIGPVVEVYDSLQSLNIRSQEIRYPILVEQAACSLSMPKRKLTFRVLEVQQQEGGNDCGLFAITFAQILCLGGHPSKYLYLQDRMREELVRYFETGDVVRYVSKVAVATDDEDFDVLYEFHSNVYCYCRMPDDGKLMLHCPVCKRWFHENCVGGAQQSPDWACRRCDKTSSEDRMYKEFFEKFRNASTKNMKETQKIQELYNVIVRILKEYKLPDAKGHIACFSYEEYNAIADKKEKGTLGLTFFGKLDFLIVIFFEQIKTDRQLLSVVIHEISHVVTQRDPNRESAPHGKTFRKTARKLTKAVMGQKDELPLPYRNIDLDPKEVERAYYSLEGCHH